MRLCNGHDIHIVDDAAGQLEHLHRQPIVRGETVLHRVAQRYKAGERRCAVLLGRPLSALMVCRDAPWGVRTGLRSVRRCVPRSARRRCCFPQEHPLFFVAFHNAKRFSVCIVTCFAPKRKPPAPLGCKKYPLLGKKRKNRIDNKTCSFIMKPERKWNGVPQYGTHPHREKRRRLL